ncbi:MAG: NifU family protein [Flavobacteriales bacterium]|nr:NifU family protein [Flavobacteriales bacterium]
MTQQEIFEKVNASLDTIRPYLEADGGNISLIEVTEDLTARVELHGACVNCSMSVMTMKAGVEGAIRAAVPQIRSVEAINISMETV